MEREKRNIYFIGIGGIGMSALARYFAYKGCSVAGYDRTQTLLTRELESEGIAVHYEDNVELIAPDFKDVDNTLVIYTPAVPKDHSELCYFMDNGFEVIKRSKALGVVTEGEYVMAVAGTHGKTSTSTMIAYLNSIAAKDGDQVGGGSAFLGGISKNFGSNLVLGRGRRIAVEADEFDRSFLQLYPDVAVVTAIDADHLDIYGSKEQFKAGVMEFISQIKRGGTLIYKLGIDIDKRLEGINIYTYALKDEKADFYTKNMELIGGGCYSYDIVCPDMVIQGCRLLAPGEVNVENSVAAVASMWVAGMDVEALKEALATFSGVRRRFDFVVNNPEGKIYMDDYAHHPEELRRAIGAVREMFPGRSITAVFQPHLFSRTRDFAVDFAASLSLVDRLIMLPIYPARELPMEGVNSEMILEMVTLEDKMVVEKDQLMEVLSADSSDILVTFGAGDIDLFPAQIKEMLS